MSQITILGQSINEQEGSVHIHIRITVESPIGEISQETSVKVLEDETLGPAWTREDIENHIKKVYPTATVSTVTRLPRAVETPANADA